MVKVILRPLQPSDALISYKWRNNPEIWHLTGNKPEHKISADIETQWIKRVLLRDDERRFAICIKETNEYIGNIQLTSISNNKAELHIFIGVVKYWGKGIASKATSQLLEFAFTELNLSEVFLKVNEKNLPAINVYKKNGFKPSVAIDGIITMVCRESDFLEMAIGK